MSLRGRLPAISRTWNEGKYLDFWSVMHFFSGALLGLVGLFSPSSFIEVFVVVVVLLVLYELWEAYMSIGEYVVNRIVDVLLGATGFVAAYWLGAVYLSAAATSVAAAALAVFLVLFATFGWRAYVRRVLTRQRK